MFPANQNVLLPTLSPILLHCVPHTIGIVSITAGVDLDTETLSQRLNCEVRTSSFAVGFGRFGQDVAYVVGGAGAEGVLYALGALKAQGREAIGAVCRLFAMAN